MYPETHFNFQESIVPKSHPDGAVTLLLKLPATIHHKRVSWMTVISPKVKQTKTAS